MTRRGCSPALAVTVAALLLAAAALPLSYADDAPIDPPSVGPPTELAPAAASGAITAEAAAEAEVQAVAEGDRTRAEVAAAKAEAKAALANADTTWAAYLADQQAQIAAAGASAASASAGGLSPSLSVMAAEAAAGPSALARRKAVFLRNLRVINKKNAKSGDMLAFGVNNFTHLSAGEFKRLYLSSFVPPTGPDGPTGNGRKLLQTSSALQCSKQVSFPSNLASLTPYNVDHRSLGTVTPVRSQGQCGSCAAFSATASIESAYIAKWKNNGFNSGNTDLSEEDLLLCTTGNGCNGAWPNVYIDRVACKGVTYESNVRYTASDNDRCPSVSRYTSGVVAWANVPNNERGFAQALAHNPISIGVSGNELQSYKSGVWSCGGNQPMNHAITLVAYTKGVGMSNGQTWNVLTAKNSWASSWGESGFVRFRADCSSTGSLKIYQFSAVLPIRG